MNLLELTLCSLVCSLWVGVQGIPIATDDGLEQGYYWRDYVRDVPSDALPGGVDKRGKHTYIGQTSHIAFKFGETKKISVPGQIREERQKMTYEWDYKEHVGTEDVKILCTHHPEQFEWIPTNKSEIVNLEKERHLVPGGVERNYSVYIGRIFLQDELAIGKVLITNDPMMEGVYTTLDGKYLHIQSAFEVLAYNANAPIISKQPVTLKLRSQPANLSSSVPEEKHIQIASSFEVADNDVVTSSAKPKTLKLESKVGSPNASNVNVVWYPMLVVVLLRSLQEFYKAPM